MGFRRAKPGSARGPELPHRDEARLSRRRLRLLAVLLALGLAGFAALAFAYDGRLGELDGDVARWVASDLPGVAEVSARPFSWLGGWIGLTILGVATGILLIRERAWLDLTFFVTAFLGSQLAVSLVKEVFDRPRPGFGSAVPLPESASFPSAHAAGGVASLGAVAVLLAERHQSPRARVWIWTVTVVLGLGVGLSRVALNVHHVSDVVAGWCFGLAWLAVCLLARDAIRPRTRWARG